MHFEDAHIIEETEHLSDGNGFFDFLINQADRLTEESRGKLAIEILIGGNYVDRPDAFRSKYHQNSEAIDGWLSEVNLQKLINGNRQFINERAKRTAEEFIRDNGPAFLFGLATGTIAVMLIKS